MHRNDTAHALPDVKLDEYLVLMEQDGLPPQYLASLRRIAKDIRPHTTTFTPGPTGLVSLAALHSPFFRALPTQEQQFLTRVMSGPFIFVSAD